MLSESLETWNMINMYCDIIGFKKMPAVSTDVRTVAIVQFI
jgi:hypothetical protein